MYGSEDAANAPPQYDADCAACPTARLVVAEPNISVQRLNRNPAAAVTLAEHELSPWCVTTRSFRLRAETISNLAIEGLDIKAC